MLSRILSLVLVVSFSSSAMAATTYYLSPLGSDGADGRSPTSAWKSIQKVNTWSFQPGDKLLLDAGHGAFAGCMSFDASHVRSTSANPFVVGVYNGSQWRLNSNCGHDGHQGGAISINGVTGIVVQDGVLAGNGTHTLYGVWIMNTVLASPADSITIQRMDISDFNTTLTSTYSAEVFVMGWPGAGLTNVQILNNSLHGLSVTALDDNGIDGYGNGQNIGAKYIGNKIYYMGGRTGRPGGTTGNGIWCNGTKSCEVANNYIHDLGANVNQCGGIVGIGTWNANNSYVHDN